MRTFKQLTQSDRVYISRLKAMGLSLSEIARRTGKNKSSISRELKRNGCLVTQEDQLAQKHLVEPEFLQGFELPATKIPAADMIQALRSAASKNQILITIEAPTSGFRAQISLEIEKK